MKKVDIRCQDCGRIVSVEEDWDETATCSECGGDFEIKGSEDDTYKKDKLNEDTEDEGELECEECGNTPSKKDLIFFKEQEIYICKKCIDKAYPRDSKVTIEYKDRIIEKPIIKYLNVEGNEITKSESSVIIGKVF